MKLFAIPVGPQRLIRFVAAHTLRGARKYNAEARLATREELSAALVKNVMIEISTRGKGIRFAEPADFGIVEQRS